MSASDFPIVDLSRFEAGGVIRPLFVMVEELDPNHFTFTRDRKAGRLKSDHPIIQRIGDVQFLGPFNDAYQLVRLKYEDPAVLGDQLHALVSDIQRVMPMFLTLRDAEGKALVTAMLPPAGQNEHQFRPIIVGHGNADPYPEHGHPHEPAKGYTLHMKIKDIDAAWTRAVDAGCEIVLPLQKMFWGERYGQLRDPFGVLWSMGYPDA